MPKNIVMILADQMHKYAMGFMRPHIHTPHLDRLAEEGVTFANCYSNNPVCGPFRINLFSGMLTISTGLYRNGDPLPDNECMADTFNANGYETSFVGKWHIGGEGNRPIPRALRGGFQHFVGYQCYNGFWDNVCFYDEEDREVRFDRHRTEVTTDLGVERLRMLAGRNRPFLHVVFYQAPHYPEQPMDPYYQLYEGRDMPLPPNYRETEPYTPTFSPPSPRPFVKDPDYRRYGGNMQEYLRLYNGMVSQIDAGVGRILAEIDTLGLRDDTLVLFSADHGDMQGSHGLTNKCLPYEESCGIPLLARLPGGVQGATVRTSVSGVDLYPTLVEYAGINASHANSWEGESLLSYLSGESGPDATHGPVYAENYLGQRRWTMVRQGPWKLVAEKDGCVPTELFHMEDDPYELDNKIGDPACAGIRNTLTELIACFENREPKPRTEYHHAKQT